MKMILILSVIPIVILACSDNENPVMEPAVTPNPIIAPINLSPPVINKIVVPNQVRASTRRIKLEAVAEDADGNTLTYDWEATAGKLLYSNTMSIAIWTAPYELGTVTITVTVNDGIHESTQSVDVRVSPALIVPGKEAAGIRLIDRLNHVIDLYGEPNHEVEAKDLDVPWDLGWDSKHNWKNDGLTVYLRNNRIFGIVISAPHTAKTAGGNGIGSRCDEVRNELVSKFGRNNRNRARSGWNGDNDYYAYIWDAKGIEIRCYLSIVKQIIISDKIENWDPAVWPRFPVN